MRLPSFLLAVVAVGGVGCTELPQVIVADGGAPVDAAMDAAFDAPADAADLGVDAALPCSTSSVPYGGGAGTADDPYRLCSVVHVDNVRMNPAASFVLASDVDFRDEATRGFAPIAELTGTLDGRGHRLVGLTLAPAGAESGDNLAFLNVLRSGRVEHLTFVDPVVTGHSMLATVALTMEGEAVLDDVHVEGGSVTASGSYVGGLVVYVNGAAVVRGSSFDGAIASTIAGGGENGFLGGIAHNVLGVVETSWTSGTITTAGGWKVGGIASVVNGSGLIDRCASHMDVLSSGNRVGGIASVLAVNAKVRDSYADGALTATELVGGIAAEVYSPTLVEITRTYAAGSLAVTVPGTSYPARGIVGMGAVLIDARIVVSSSLWDTDATGLAESGVASGTTGRTTAQMQTRDTFVGWESPPWTFRAGARPRLDFEP